MTSAVPAAAARDAVPWGLAELCGVVAVFAGSLLATVQLSGPFAPEDHGALMLAHLPAHLLTTAAVVTLAWVHGARGRAALGLGTQGIARKLALGLGAYVGFLLVWGPLVFFGYARLLEALGTRIPEQAAMRWLLDHRDAPGFVLMLVAVALTGPVMEECCFRGLLQPWLVARIGAAPGIVVTSALFGLMHTPVLYLALPIGLIGLFLGVVRHRSGSLLLPAVLHAVHNSLTLAVCLSSEPLYRSLYGTQR
jgi:membrane protease YdiL (CAAX protease family)